MACSNGFGNKFSLFVELIIALADKIEIFSYHEIEFGEPSSEHASIKDETTQEVLYHLHSKVYIYDLEIENNYGCLCLCIAQCKHKREFECLICVSWQVFNSGYFYKITF